MAGFEMGGIDDLMQELERMGDLSEIAPKMIDAATPIVTNSLKGNIEIATNEGYATGELKKSIKATKAKKNNYGYFASVSATGKDSKGIRNGEKLAYLHYGTSKQRAKPVITKTVNECEEEAVGKMQEVFDREMGL